MKTMKHIMATCALTIAAVIPSYVIAANPDEIALLQKLKKTYPKTTFSKISATPVKGIYEIRMGQNIAYTDGAVRYWLFGALFDMKTQRDLTGLDASAGQPANQDAQGATVNKPTIDFDKLPLDKAITYTRGKGERKLAIFSDPDCPFCKQLEKTIDTMDNLTVYIFPFPLVSLHPDAHNKSVNMWCTGFTSADKPIDKDAQAKQWRAMMLQNAAVANANPDCKHPIDTFLKLGSQLGVQGTPTLIAADGRITAGALPREALETWLNQQGAKQ